jgi:hydrogenase expression/formation protein HypC
MCLAIPMQIVQVDGHNAVCSMQGVRREVSLFLVQDQALAVGDFVLVHVGYAIQTLTAEEAQASLELFDELMTADDIDAESSSHA